MDVIHKFEVSPDKQFIEMPKGSEILSAGAQDQGIFIWAKVAHGESQGQGERREIMAYPTGMPLTAADHTFIGTVFLDWMVFHIFELK